jgi:hypothetical protein
MADESLVFVFVFVFVLCLLLIYRLRFRVRVLEIPTHLVTPRVRLGVVSIKPRHLRSNFEKPQVYI